MIKYTIYNVDGDVLGYYLDPREDSNGIFECTNEEFAEMRQTIDNFTKLQAELLDKFDEQFTEPQESEEDREIKSEEYTQRRDTFYKNG